MKPSPLPPFGLAALPGALALGTAGLLASGGCTGATEPDAEDAGVFEAQDATGGTCASCVADQCTAAWALCLTSESCIEVRDCARGAPDAAACTCEASTDGGGASAAKLHRAFTTCNDARTCADPCAGHCTSSCATPPTTTPAACGGTAPATDRDASTDAEGDAALDAGGADASDAALPSLPAASADACARCAETRCASAKNACAIGSECAAFLECSFACADGACVTECGRSHATGKVAAVELAACAQAGCGTECGL